MTPVLYVKAGCPYCRAATDYLDERGIAYEKIEVRGSDKAMRKLQEISGQMKTPTLQWDGNVLADFGVDQLEEFMQQHGKP